MPEFPELARHNFRNPHECRAVMKTKSETLFEGFLTANNLPFEKI